MYTRTITRDLRACFKKTHAAHTRRHLRFVSRTNGLQAEASQTASSGQTVTLEMTPTINISDEQNANCCSTGIGENGELQLNHVLGTSACVHMLGSSNERRLTPPHIARGKGMKECFDRYYLIWTSVTVGIQWQIPLSFVMDLRQAEAGSHLSQSD